MRLRAAFAQNLRVARQSRSLSQEALADLAELDRTYISALERELYSASLDTVERLAKALQMDVADLVRDTSQPKATINSR